MCLTVLRKVNAGTGWNAEPFITGNIIEMPYVVNTKEDEVAKGHVIRTVKMTKIWQLKFLCIVWKLT